MVLKVTLGQQYNVGERPTVKLYTYINRHTRPPNATKTYTVAVFSLYGVCVCVVIPFYAVLFPLLYGVFLSCDHGLDF